MQEETVSSGNSIPSLPPMDTYASSTSNAHNDSNSAASHLNFLTNNNATLQEVYGDSQSATSHAVLQQEQQQQYQHLPSASDLLDHNGRQISGFPSAKQNAASAVDMMSSFKLPSPSSLLNSSTQSTTTNNSNASLQQQKTSALTSSTQWMQHAPSQHQQPASHHQTSIQPQQQIHHQNPDISGFIYQQPALVQNHQPVHSQQQHHQHPATAQQQQQFMQNSHVLHQVLPGITGHIPHGYTSAPQIHTLPHNYAQLTAAANPIMATQGMAAAYNPSQLQTAALLQQYQQAPTQTQQAPPQQQFHYHQYQPIPQQQQPQAATLAIPQTQQSSPSSTSSSTSSTEETESASSSPTNGPNGIRKNVPKPYSNGRKRVSKACLECQQRHVRCGFERPCERCKRLGLNCVDVTSTKKRGRRSVSTPKPSIIAGILNGMNAANGTPQGVASTSVSPSPVIVPVTAGSNGAANIVMHTNLYNTFVTNNGGKPMKQDPYQGHAVMQQFNHAGVIRPKDEYHHEMQGHFRMQAMPEQAQPGLPQPLAQAQQHFVGHSHHHHHHQMQSMGAPPHSNEMPNRSMSQTHT